MSPRISLTLNPGDRIGDYEILEPIGAGGMGAVFKVRHLISHRVEALKVIVPEAALAASDSADRFLREIRLLAGLQHVNIAGLHNAFMFQDQMVMAMEFIEGVSLDAKLHPPGISLTQALNYAIQILMALSYAHARGVIHRDVKPSNVMIQPNEVVKLLDFGLATTGHDPALTQPGAILGTPFYISPEQARGERADARSDVYSAGALLYELAAGKPPFDAGDHYAIIFAHMLQDPRSPGEYNSKVPPGLSRIILKALAKKPSDRFQTADEFLSALQMVGREVKSLSTELVSRIPRERAADSNAITFAADEIEQAKKDLALYIGPIAHIIVKRAAANSRSLGELYRTLSEEISSTSQREQFLAAMPRKGS
jgi:eukaryotic-like serine/threonine-protein kinase